MFFVEALKSYIFPEECGVYFSENSDLDIEECFLSGKVFKNDDDGYSVEIIKIEAIIFNKSNKTKTFEGYIDVTKVVPESNLEDFRQDMIKYALSFPYWKDSQQWEKEI